MPNHQFGLQKKYDTIEENHRMIQQILWSEEKEYCSAFFLNIEDAFDAIW